VYPVQHVVIIAGICHLSAHAYTKHSNAGGGGERVLWTAVTLMQRTEPDIISVIYSGDTDTSKEQIIAKAKVRPLVFPSPPLLTLVLVGPVRYNARTALTSFCIPRVEVARRGPRMATVYAPRAELGLHVPRMGGVVQVRPGPLYRCVYLLFSSLLVSEVLYLL
jgi:ALG11 mannosyltransferase N-terminus